VRDPNRIPRILAKLQKLWEAMPDQRLGQLINNILTLQPSAYSWESDLWHSEDTEWESMIDEYLKTKRILAG
jgi:hypothetical protein